LAKTQLRNIVVSYIWCIVKWRVKTRIAPVWFGLEAEKNFGLVASAVVEDAEALFPESATSTPGSNHIYVHWPHHLRTVHYHLKWRKLLKIQHHNDAHSL
jgi:hypothetical protein